MEDNKVGNIIYHEPEDNFKKVNFEVIKNFDCMTIGLYCKIIAMSAEWKLNINGLATVLDISKEKVKTSIQKLERDGFMKRVPVKNENGKFAGYSYHFYPLALPMEERTMAGYKKNGVPENGGTQKMGYPENDIPNNNREINNNRFKENNKKEEKISLSNDKQKDELFEKFWADYGRKGTKGNALKEWNKLKDKDKNQLISNTPKYIIYCKRSNRAIKDASTFIHQRCFDEDWDIIPDYYQVQEADSERQARFKNYMVSRFKDLIYHRNPLTYEEATELLEQYEADQFEWAMERLTKRNIHQYYSIKSAINKIMQEEDFDG